MSNTRWPSRLLALTVGLILVPPSLHAQTNRCGCERCLARFGAPGTFTIRNYDMRAMSVLARSSTARHFSIQARNGDMLDHTLWSHHFKDSLRPPSAKLLPSGMALIERVSRRRGLQPLELFVQQMAINDAYQLDPTLDPRHPLFEEGNDNGVIVLHRGLREVNALRQAAVREYATHVLGRSPQELIVLLHNPPGSGIPASEAARAVEKMITEGPIGILPKEMATYPGFLGGK